MFGHIVLTFYRSVARHRLFAALNALGLAAGIAVFLILLLDVRFETSFDRFLPHADETFRLDETLLRPGLAPRQSGKTTAVIAPLLKADYPEVLAVARLVPTEETISRGEILGQEDVRYADPDLLEVLELPLVAGDRARALAAPDDVVVTESVARKYFGTTDVLGRRLTIVENGVRSDVRVSAVLKDLPRNTHLKLGVLKALSPAVEGRFQDYLNWSVQWGSTYVRLRSAADAAAIDRDLPRFLDRRAAGGGENALGDRPRSRLVLRLTPLPAIHFETAIASPDFQPNVDARIVSSLLAVGVLALAIAVLNYVNLATARASQRAREVAVRKALGATRSLLLAQFLMEAVVMALGATLVAVALTELALPLVNAAGGLALRLPYGGPGGLVPALLALALLVGVAGGVYPAVLLSAFRPAEVLAAARMPGGGRMSGRVRSLLVVAQFAAAIGCVICTLVLSAQSRHLEQGDRGFRRDNLILVDSLSEPEVASRQGVVLDALRRVPGVTSVSASDREPAPKVFNALPVEAEGRTGPPPNLVLEVVGPDYFRTYGAAVIAGRPFDLAHRLDDPFAGAPPGASPPIVDVMINKAAARIFGFRDARAAVGRSLKVIQRTGVVVGVADDIRFMSPHERAQPMIYLFSSGEIDGAIGAVRFQGETGGEMMRRLKAAWREAAPGQPFAATLADVRLGAYFLPDRQRARLFLAGSVLAVVIGCLGLYGLAAFTTTRRAREFGVRKTLGASSVDILRLVLGEFLRPILLANLIAWPVAYVAMRIWLSGFDQRIALTPLYFLSATLLTLVIAFATVSGHGFAVARAEPARALRHE